MFSITRKVLRPGNRNLGRATLNYYVSLYRWRNRTSELVRFSEVMKLSVLSVSSIQTVWKKPIRRNGHGLKPVHCCTEGRHTVTASIRLKQNKNCVLYIGFVYRHRHERTCSKHSTFLVITTAAHGSSLFFAVLYFTAILTNGALINNKRHVGCEDHL